MQMRHKIWIDQSIDILANAKKGKNEVVAKDTVKEDETNRIESNLIVWDVISSWTKTHSSSASGEYSECTIFRHLSFAS